MDTFITDNATLTEFCRSLATEPFVTVDTEFLRESTYYSKLCLIQIAGADHAAAIDALAPGIDLQPVYDLLANPDVVVNLESVLRRVMPLDWQRQGAVFAGR